MDKLNECVEEVVIRAESDWIDAAEVVHVAISVGGAFSDEDVMRLSLAIVEVLLRDELAVVGDVTVQDGFVRWQMTSKDALDRIAREWADLNRSPNLGELFWLLATPSGDAKAEELLRREKL